MVDAPAPASPAAASPAPAPAAAPTAAPPAQPPASPASSPDGLLAAAVAAKAAAPAADGTPAAQPAPGIPARPADIPEQFWNAEKGEIRTDAITKAWKDSRDQIKALSADRKVPETADAYKFTKPQALTREIPSDDPALQLFSKAAHAAKLSQAQYDALAGHFLMGVDAMVPPALDLAAEKAKLGPNADAVINQVVTASQRLVDSGVWSKDEFDEIVVMGSTALGMSALHKAFVNFGEKPIPLTGATIEGLPSEEEAYAMMGDPKYKTDPAYREKVRDTFEKVFGTEPASSSKPGLGVGSAVRRTA